MWTGGGTRVVVRTRWFFGSSCRVGGWSIWPGNVVAIGCSWAWSIDGGIRPPARPQRLQLRVWNLAPGAAGGGHRGDGRELDSPDESGRIVRHSQIPESRQGGGSRPYRGCGDKYGGRRSPGLAR